METVLTTVDNPFDPFKNWDAWLRFDEDHGYNTNSLLASFSKTSNNFTDSENELMIDKAMDKIIELFPSMYKKVFKED